jgi:hypothetical protein
VDAAGDEERGMEALQLAAEQLSAEEQRGTPPDPERGRWQEAQMVGEGERKKTWAKQYLWWGEHLWAHDSAVQPFISEPIEQRLLRIHQQVSTVVEMDRCTAFTSAKSITQVMDERECNSSGLWASLLTAERFLKPVRWEGDVKEPFAEHIRRFERTTQGCILYFDFPQQSRIFNRAGYSTEAEADAFFSGGYENWMLQVSRGATRQTVGRQVDNAELASALPQDVRRLQRQKWQALVPASAKQQFIGWDDTEAMDHDLLATFHGNGQGNEDSAPQTSWPEHLRDQESLLSGRDAWVFFTEGPSGNGLHKDPVGGFATLVRGWKVWLWWDAEDSDHMVNRSKPALGIRVVKAAAESATLRWTLQAPGQTLFVHPDQCHIVISLCDTILLTQNRTFLPFHLLRSIGLVLRGRVWDDSWTTAQHATSTNTYPALILFIFECLRKRQRDWRATHDERSAALVVEGWNALKQSILEVFYRTDVSLAAVRMPRVLKPRHGSKPSKRATADIFKHMGAIEELLNHWMS